MVITPFIVFLIRLIYNIKSKYEIYFSNINKNFTKSKNKYTEIYNFITSIIIYNYTIKEENNQ